MAVNVSAVTAHRNPGATGPRSRASPSRRSGLPLDWRDWLAVVALTTLAAVLALYDLGSRSLWLDEGDTFATASQHGAALWRWAFNDGGNMVIYYLGMHLTLSLFGTSTIVLRLPSALAAVGATPTSFFLLRRLFDRRAALFGAAFEAASMSMVYWGQQARGYSVAAFLVTASTLAFVVAVQGGHRYAYLAYVGFSVLAVYTVLLSALALVAQAVSLLIRPPQQIPRRQLAFCGLAICLLCVPVSVAATLHGSTPVHWVAPFGNPLGPAGRGLVEFLASDSPFWPSAHTAAHLVLMAMAALWAFAILLWARSFTGRAAARTVTWSYGLLLAWFVVPVVLTYMLSQLVHPLLVDRYVLDAVPPASMIAGVVCSRLRPLPIAVAAGMALLVIRTFVILPSYGAPLENWRGATADVLARAHPRDCIAFFTSDGYMPFDYYVLARPALGPPPPTPVLPRSSWVSRTPHVLQPAAFPPALLHEAVTSCPRLWLLSSHTLGAPPARHSLAYQVLVYTEERRLMSQVHAFYRVVSTTGYVDVTVTLYLRTTSRAQ